MSLDLVQSVLEAVRQMDQIDHVGFEYLASDDAIVAIGEVQFEHNLGLDHLSSRPRRQVDVHSPLQIAVLDWLQT